jgi:DNA-binding beta-propeller fold protein YncE
VYVADAAGKSLTVLAFDGSEIIQDTRFAHDDPYFIPVSNLASVTASPDGRQVYGVNPETSALLMLNAQDPSVTDSWIDGLDGVDGLAEASHVAVSRDGQRVYVAAPGEAAVGVFDRDAMTGALAFLSVIPIDPTGFGTPGALAVSLDSGTLYVACRGGIAGFDTASATLAHAVTAVGLDPCAIAASPAGVALCVAGDRELRRYGADLGPSPQVIGGLRGASAVRVSPDGKYVYVALADEDAVVVFEELEGELDPDPV